VSAELVTLISIPSDYFPATNHAESCKKNKAACGIGDALHSRENFLFARTCSCNKKKTAIRSVIDSIGIVGYDIGERCLQARG
jgi:hypothetical protein